MDKDPNYRNWSNTYSSMSSSSTASDAQSYNRSDRYVEPKYQNWSNTYPSLSSSTAGDVQSYDGSDKRFDTPALLSDIRHTPSTLGWSHGTELLQMYVFTVPKGGEPSFDLLPQWKPTGQTPSKVYLDPPRDFKKNQYPCVYPGPCNGKQNVFNRPADLQRHYKMLHGPKEDFPCDYAKCGRSKDPFTRKDHYRDHLRDFHKEDIGMVTRKRSIQSQSSWEESRRTWLAERRINHSNWRCTRCLIKCYTAEVGWECPGCNTACEQDRIKARESQKEEEQKWKGEEQKSRDSYSMELDDGVPTYAGAQSCDTCNGIEWINDGYGRWQLCHQCNPGSTFVIPAVGISS